MRAVKVRAERTRTRTQVYTLLEKRNALVSGAAAPTDEDVASEGAAELAPLLKHHAAVTEADSGGGDGDGVEASDADRGVPEFWPLAMRECGGLALDDFAHGD